VPLISNNNFKCQINQ